jgi:ribose/xylose/arabinose/galactoside ABC-type transport system permease subunit
LGFAAHIVLLRTVMGRRLYAVGQNPRAALISGVPVVRTIVGAYTFSGFCAAVASIFYTARLHTGSPTLVENEVLLDCIGAAVIGGTSLFGGKGRVPGILLGVFFMALVGNSLNMLGLRYWHVIMVKGGVILLAAFLDALRTRWNGAE